VVDAISTGERRWHGMAPLAGAPATGRRAPELAGPVVVSLARGWHTVAAYPITPPHLPLLMQRLQMMGLGPGRSYAHWMRWLWIGWLSGGGKKVGMCHCATNRSSICCGLAFVNMLAW
jgi:hypothetical protein